MRSEKIDFYSQAAFALLFPRILACGWTEITSVYGFYSNPINFFLLLLIFLEKKREVVVSLR